jgi:hypothetical protein
MRAFTTDSMDIYVSTGFIIASIFDSPTALYLQRQGAPFSWPTAAVQM